MTDIEKDVDAADRAPKPETDAGKTVAPRERQDAKNDGGTKNDGGSVPIDDMNSANDE